MSPPTMRTVSPSDHALSSTPWPTWVAISDHASSSGLPVSLVSMGGESPESSVFDDAPESEDLEVPPQALIQQMLVANHRDGPTAGFMGGVRRA